MLYQLNDALDEVIVDRSGTAETYDDFISQLPQEEPRFAVYDLAPATSSAATWTAPR